MKSLKYLVLAAALATPGAFADISETAALQVKSGVLSSYQNVLSLEGGSNFRDLGGYVTADGKVVRKGLLYRSGVMTNLTEQDEKYLAGFGFETVVDLRSEEERDLFPNHWAPDSGINYVAVDYHFMDMMEGKEFGPHVANPYKDMPYFLIPQLKAYFEKAIAGEVPMVVNCSAGQDRTGITAALMLTALGVPRPQVMQDYVLSTEYRRPLIEMGNVDLESAAENNPFAKLMLRYVDKQSSRAAPLITNEGIPYLYFAFKQIESDYGSVETFLDKELGVDQKDLAQLREMYLD